MDLSFPSGKSVNNFILSDICSLHYPSVDDRVDLVLALGQYTQLVKIDLKSAYRILPIHPMDKQLLGIRSQGLIFLLGPLSTLLVQKWACK